MVPVTRQVVGAASGPVEVRQSPTRALVIAFLVALFVHVPFTPLPFVLSWLRLYLDRDSKLLDYADDRVVIPISLSLEGSEPPPPSSTSADPAAAGPPSPAAAPGDPHDAGIRDAAAADRVPSPDADAGASTQAVASARPAPPRRASETSDAAVAAAGAKISDAAVAHAAPGDAGGPGVKDPMSLVGGLRRAVSGKPNVSVVLWFSTMREHPLGPLVGSIFACIPQWRDFLGDAVNPLEDLDGVMIVGPQLRDSSKLTILAQSRMPDEKVQRIFDVLAHRSGGAAVETPAGMHAVRFRADRADRVALTHPRSMVIVTPPEGFEQLRDLREPLSLPAGHGRAMSLGLVTPWRPARALGLRLPETLNELRVDISAASDGGVNISIELDDENASSAEAHAPELTAQAAATGGPLLSDLEFAAQGSRIHADTHFSRFSSAIVLGYLRPMLCPLGFDAGRGRQ